MTDINKYGSWALVVGAAEGLGEAYSIALARRKMNLIMLDNQIKALDTLSEQLVKEYGIETLRLPLDLRKKDANKEIIKACEGYDVGFLVYNAAISHIKPFVDHTEDDLEDFVEVNVKRQLQLVHAFSKSLISRNKKGGIILMSSLAGLIGMQLVAPYAATKAFAWNLAEALHHELKPFNIDVMACIAGATATPAFNKTNAVYGRIKPLIMQPKDVAEEALSKFGKRALLIPGFSNRLNYFILTRLLPRKIASKIANDTMYKMYKHRVSKK